jgi:hypothetical protein
MPFYLHSSSRNLIIYHLTFPGEMPPLGHTCSYAKAKFSQSYLRVLSTLKSYALVVYSKVRVREQSSMKFHHVSCPA